MKVQQKMCWCNNKTFIKEVFPTKDFYQKIFMFRLAQDKNNTLKVI